MWKVLFFKVCLLVLVLCNASAQNCETPDLDSIQFFEQYWIGDNQLLYDVADSIEVLYSHPAQPEHNANYPFAFDLNALLRIPVKVWVYETANQSGLAVGEIERAIERLNRQFRGVINNFSPSVHNHSLIQFYLKHQVSYIVDAAMAITPNFAQREIRFQDNYEPGCVNIHIMLNYNGGVARLPGFYTVGLNPFVFGIGAGSINTSTFSHEMGHALGLVHTHHSITGFSRNENAPKCFQEPVARWRLQPIHCGSLTNKNKCEVNGDGLCDTPADPYLNTQRRNAITSPLGPNPVYNPTANDTDKWGDPWHPDIFNIMSYSYDTLCERFSQGQINIMYSWITGSRVIKAAYQNTFPYLNFSNTTVDIYEPDNNPTINFATSHISELLLNEPQWHSFHSEPNGKRGIETWSNHDVDWLRIVIPQPGFKVDIETKEVPNNRPIADTWIYLLDESRTNILGSNDDKHIGTGYSKITELQLAPGNYWLKIENKANNEGEYLVEMRLCEEVCCFNGYIGNASEINLTTTGFVLGSTVINSGRDYFGTNLLVKDNNFGVNTHGVLGFQLTGTLNPLSNSDFQLTFCNEAEIGLENGTLEIGDPTNGRTAEVRFTEGTKLDVDGSSQIIVKNGSKLIIEAGAELNMAAGAQVILAGSNAVLEIAGTLRLGNNQYFSPATQAGQTRGYIRLLPGAQIVTGLGAQIALGEVNNFRKVLELAPNAQIALPATLAQFSINHGEVQMAAGSRLLVHTKAVFMHAHFERLGTTGLHQGVLLTGNYPHQISASRFNHASTGLELNLTNNLHRPQLLTNQFNNNERGLVVQGGGLLIGNGSFTGNTQRALTLNAVAASVQINNVQFTNNAHGIFIHSANSHPISINSCLLQRSNIGGTAVEVWQGNVSMRSNTVQNHQTGLIAYGNDSRVRLACNQFNNNQIALDPGYWGLVDLSNQARNVIANANIAIYPDLGHVLLDQGFNDFSNANTYVLVGDIAPNCFTYTTLSKPGIDYGFYELPAENNKFESNFLQPNISNIPISNNLVTTYVPNHSCDGIVMWLDENDPRPIFRKATNHNIAFLSCNQAAPPWWHDVFNTADLGGDPTQWLVYSPLYPGIELKQAIVTALNDITTDLENPQNDSMALERLKQLLTATYSNMDETGQALLATANAAMNYALINAYTLGILPVNYGINPEPLDDKVYTLLSSFDDLIANTDDQHLKVKYALDKVLLYRLAGHYETAIAELQNSLANQHQNFGYWDCILQLEWSYFQGHIGADQFAQEAQQCMSMFQARRRRRQPPSMPNYYSTANNALAVSPNPSNSSSTVSFTRTESPAWLQLTDAQGKLVYRLPIELGSTQVNLNAQQLPMGVYLIELHEPAKTVLRAKWVVSN